MASSDPVTDLQDEATCSICLEYFRDPVSVECGHSFCRPCISEAWRGVYTNFSCPQCRKTSKWKKLRPNRELASVVEISMRIGAQGQEAAARKSELCTRHGEALKLYCEEDQIKVCAICRESGDHRYHSVLPADEVTQEYKNSSRSNTNTLYLRVLLSYQITLLSPTAKEKVRMEKQKCVKELAQLRQMLSDREHAVFARLEETEKRIALTGQGNVKKFSEKISSLTQLITEIEQKSRQPAKEFLKDVNKILSRSNYVTFQHPDPASPRKKCSLLAGPKDWMKNHRVSITVDPLTAHVQLNLSRDKRTMKYVEDALFFQDNPERFNGKPCALARQGFFHGAHYWEVEVGGGVYWTVGAARESVRRKGVFKIKPSAGIWAIGLLGLYHDEYWAFTSQDTPLVPNESPSTIGVFLDFDKGQISFYNAESMETLFIFNDCFTEKIYPFFCVGAVGTELRI
uniref:E3 ubiquitin-protein ligase TRIM39-like isoform X2 n=1 Tax=Geotrypetes seraphini TaxID=260995 RepID=A0A6P8N9L0_GEOSA|nr:E3 ubiquitin-protein ligase TRIM39-like isoform X2 [Geotrypetes seraphini]